MAAKLHAHLFVQSLQTRGLVFGDQWTVRKRVFGIGDFLVENRPDLGLCAQMLLDFFQRAFTLVVTRLRRGCLIGDIQHCVGRLHGFLDLADDQPLITLNTGNIQQGERLVVQYHVVALGFACEIGTAIANDFPIGQGVHFLQEAFTLEPLSCVLLHQGVFALLCLTVLHTQGFDGAIPCSHHMEKLLLGKGQLSFLR
ncbi:hypothetical protein D3C85_1223010 [compost metagenome]